MYVMLTKYIFCTCLNYLQKLFSQKVHAFPYIYSSFRFFLWLCCMSVIIWYNIFVTFKKKQKRNKKIKKSQLIIICKEVFLRRWECKYIPWKLYKSKINSILNIWKCKQNARARVKIVLQKSISYHVFLWMVLWCFC